MQLWPKSHPGHQVCAPHGSCHPCRDIKPEHLYFDKDLRLKLGHFPQAVNLALYPIPPQKAALLDYTAPEVTAFPFWCCWGIVKHAASPASPCCMAPGGLAKAGALSRQCESAVRCPGRPWGTPLPCTCLL